LRQAYDYWQDQPGKYFQQTSVFQQSRLTEFILDIQKIDKHLFLKITSLVTSLIGSKPRTALNQRLGQFAFSTIDS